MAYLLQKGQSFTIGTAENTLQSFNGGIGAVRTNMYVEISATSIISHASGLNDGLQGYEEIEFTISAADAGKSKVEAGDTVVVYAAADKANTSHDLFITSVSHSGGDVIVNGYVTDYTNGTQVDATDNNVTIGDIGSGDQYCEITLDTLTNAPAQRIYAEHISAATFTYNDGTDHVVDLLTAFPGLQGYEYNPVRDSLLLSFSNGAQGNAARETLRNHISNDDTDNITSVSFTYDVTDSAVIWNMMDSEHVIHVGSKTNNTVEVVTPITLPADVTIKAGAGVGDIFLIKVTE